VVDASDVSVPTRNKHAGAAELISLAAPIDFPTGATPSAAAFNRAEGDQLGLQNLHQVLSNSLAVDDFDHDGDPDVAESNVIAGSVSVFLGDGERGFAPEAPFAVGALPSFVTAAQLDLDRHADLAVANVGSNDVAIFRGDGKGGFALAQRIPVPDPRNVAAGDFNGDDVPDLAIASAGPVCPRPAPPCAASVSPVGGVVILTGSTDVSGHVTFVPAQLLTLVQSRTGIPVGANTVAVGDFDRSGFDDIAIGAGASARAETPDDALTYLNRNRHEGDPFDASPSQALLVGATPEDIIVGDWNDDDWPDLAVLDGMSGDVTTLLGDNGTFTLSATNNTVGAHPRSVDVGDFNGDAIADLVTANWDSSTVSVLEGNGRGGKGNGTFQPAVDFFSGGATSAVGVGHFDGDRRVDVVAARLRNDHLALLVNDSPRHDGVTVTRDIPYLPSADDAFAAYHTLDVYEPAAGTTSFAGRGEPYPVLLYAHGGAGVTGDKTCISYLMRSLAREGIIAVSTDYRLVGPSSPDEAADLANAFRWTRAHIGASPFGGDPSAIVVAGTSAGAANMLALVSSATYAAEQQHIRGAVIGNFVGTADRPAVPTLLLTGSDGLEAATSVEAAMLAAEWKAAGTDATHVAVEDRDHLTQPAYLAVPGDHGRTALLSFLRARFAG
jgi:predicted alpha/beta-hydrolase family hydrolase